MTEVLKPSDQRGRVSPWEKVTVWTEGHMMVTADFQLETLSQATVEQTCQPRKGPSKMQTNYFPTYRSCLWCDIKEPSGRQVGPGAQL